MVCHPNRHRQTRRRLYTAEMGGARMASGPIATFPTIRKCRMWAEEYGQTADRCTITDTYGRVVALHRRDNSGDGTRWYRAVGAGDRG
jgi:hypothetical protein